MNLIVQPQYIYIVGLHAIAKGLKVNPYVLMWNNFQERFFRKIKLGSCFSKDVYAGICRKLPSWCILKKHNFRESLNSWEKGLGVCRVAYFLFYTFKGKHLIYFTLSIYLLSIFVNKIEVVYSCKTTLRPQCLLLVKCSNSDLLKKRMFQ